MRPQTYKNEVRINLETVDNGWSVEVRSWRREAIEGTRKRFDEEEEDEEYDDEIDPKSERREQHRVFTFDQVAELNSFLVEVTAPVIERRPRK